MPEQRVPSISSDQASASAPPLTRAELEALYLQQRLSLQQIADLASKRLGITVSRAKVREWLLWHRIARRSFSEAAQVKFEKKTRSGSAGGSVLGSDVQPSLFEK